MQAENRGNEIVQVPFIEFSVSGSRMKPGVELEAFAFSGHPVQPDPDHPVFSVERFATDDQQESSRGVHVESGRQTGLNLEPDVAFENVAGTFSDAAYPVVVETELQPEAGAEGAVGLGQYPGSRL